MATIIGLLEVKLSYKMNKSEMMMLRRYTYNRYVNISLQDDVPH